MYDLGGVGTLLSHWLPVWGEKIFAPVSPGKYM